MSDKILRIDESDPRPDRLRSAVEALRRDEIIAFPTETVYGLGIRPGAESGAGRLNALKGRRPDHPVTLHLAASEPLDAHAGPVQPLARRLADRFLPGPLTLLLPARESRREVGIRVPNHAVCQALLEGIGGALLATSANLTGERPATRMDRIPVRLLDAVGLAIDSGPTRYATASSVARPVGDRVELIRAGAVPAALLQDECGPVTLIVCTGNTCRSPMAAALLRGLLHQRFKRAREARGMPLPAVHSAGIGALEGGPASGNAILAGREFGLDLRDHVSRRLAPEQIHASDFILAMSAGSGELLREMAPGAIGRIEVLNRDGGGIPDPFGGVLEEYRAVAEILQGALEGFLDRYAERFAGSPATGT
jgi:tRNA threonylcarbamoyl adenosine modification protein (Sua5/YciO/YrdC/YwlC family)